MKFYMIMIASALALTSCDGKSDSSGDHKKPDHKVKAPKPSHPKPTPKPQPGGNSGLNKTAQAWVNAHNNYRHKHRANNIKWSTKLAKSAQNYANKCVARHSNSGYGENLAFASYKQNVKDVVKLWYKEESRYNYNNPGFSMSTGHFTQVVWRNTTHIGCAQATNCPGGWSSIVVCQYYPAGNYSGQFDKNVLPKS